MTAAAENLEFNGSEPKIVGQNCSGLKVQHFYEDASLRDPANVVFFRFQDVWHRIYFETGTVFWRSGDSPEPPVNSTLTHGVLLNDLSELSGVVGKELLGTEYSATVRGDVSVTFHFAGNFEFSLRYDTELDATRIDASPRSNGP
jgi:hypothetical protein